MKCPACGFETPGEPRWCDFCKEPFLKGAAPAAAKKPPAKISPEVMAKLMRAGSAPRSEGPKGPVEIPAEFAHLDTGGKIPEIDPAVRKLCWIVFGICCFWIFFATAWLLTIDTGALPR